MQGGIRTLQRPALMMLPARALPVPSLAFAVWILGCGATAVPIESEGGSEPAAEQTTEANETDLTGDDARVDDATDDCPRPTLSLDPQPTGDAPDYTRAMWLTDSLATASAVVFGSAEGDTWHIERVLCGSIDGPPTIHRLRRPAAGTEGVWMLVRTTRGFFNANPELVPLPLAEWQRLIADLDAPRDEPELEERATPHQLYRFYRRDDDTIWHGVEVSENTGELFVSLHQHGERVTQRAFDGNGLERVWHKPARGWGFALQWARGTLWRFEHYVDGELDGVERVFARGTERLRRETHHRNGRRHGRHRAWDDTGTIEADVTYEEGLPIPVTHSRREVEGTQIFHGPDGGVSYGAPNALILRIRLGMTVQQVADLLGQPVSETTGVWFPAYTCETGVRFSFRRGRVSEREELPNGAHCLL